MKFYVKDMASRFEELRYNSILFRYQVLETGETKERNLTAKQFLRMWRSGNNGYWDIYFKEQWRSDIRIFSPLGIGYVEIKVGYDPTVVAA